MKTFALSILMACAAFAQNAHFIEASAALQSNGNLEVQFKEAGLGNNATALMRAAADATAEYACLNGGGNHPQAANKETVSGPVSAQGSFTSGKNGNIVGSLTLSPPGPGSFSCPNGQRLVLVSVSYTNVTITNLTFNDSAAIPGTFSAVLFPGL
jgi:hypothetical protein